MEPIVRHSFDFHQSARPLGGFKYRQPARMKQPKGYVMNIPVDIEHIVIIRNNRTKAGLIHRGAE